ncbi:MAG TPA: hypothetical protein VGB06_00240 [Solirubrobacterales bacterium]|jgi:hypothetical protein
MCGPPDKERLAWYEIDPTRFHHETRRLKKPWTFEQGSDGRYSWRGGTVAKRYKGKSAPPRCAQLIYPYGFPARFIEARLEPNIPRDFWGMLGLHVNADGSACYVNGDGWSPQDTVQKALELFEEWWWNYYWLVEMGVEQTWPSNGLVEV